MAVERLQFWFEFASTYSYVAVVRIERLAKRAGIALEWKPFLLGPIFKAQGWNDSPFNLFPVKGRYMWRDLERLCAQEHIPFRKPSQFPRNGLLAARIACFGVREPWCPEFTRRVFQANFAEDRDISAPATVRSILDALGVDGAAVCSKAAADDTKERLRLQTEEASRLGIFGAPSFVVGRELFWGNDRLEDAIRWAGAEAPKDTS